jgi:hypothetical protein
MRPNAVRLRCLVAAIFAPVVIGVGTVRPVNKITPRHNAEQSDPKATYRAYIEAILANDARNAMRRWYIDDKNASGALDVIVGMCISSRMLEQLAAKRFGKEGAAAIPDGWHRNAASDRALRLTIRRLTDATGTVTGTTAEVRIKWREGDGREGRAFEFGKSAIPFRKVRGEWKIDANRRCDVEHAAELFEPGSWGRLFRDQVGIMNRAVDGIRSGKISTAKALAGFIKTRLAALEDPPKDGPK